ncbi:MAG: alpha-ketoglutarate-dependent dioxygenase AlkB [Gemmatimonadaceae bacterium]|nr:alpha-ketoglutarate-dependent dioxygenase AlkB [Gemmatimonadaceae bacterium]
MSLSQAPLFEADVPDGFRYQADFISSDEETVLAAEIGRIEFSIFEMRGVVARRRVAFFGTSYDRGPAATPPLPDFLLHLRDKLAALAGVEARAFAMALINEYRPGTPIGWHRDAPQYDIVAGISLLSPCRMKFRPYVRPGERTATAAPRRVATHAVVLERRSAYLLTGAARNAYEHHIPEVTTLRYSITLRTVRP